MKIVRLEITEPGEAMDVFTFSATPDSVILLQKDYAAREKSNTICVEVTIDHLGNFDQRTFWLLVVNNKVTNKNFVLTPPQKDPVTSRFTNLIRFTVYSAEGNVHYADF
jgi:hypothetical protein